MITLPKLVVTQTDDVATGASAGKAGADGAQDFLGLLTGALSGVQRPGSDAPVTLADLQAAALSGKLAKGSINGAAVAAAGGDARAQTPAQKLADLLARQDAKADIVASAQSDEEIAKLFSGLSPAAKTDLLAALSKTAKASDVKADSDTPNEDLAGLSALMAMLPHQQAAQLSSEAKPTATTAAIDAGASAKTALAGRTLNDAVDSDQPRGNGKADTAANGVPFKAADGGQQNAPIASTFTIKREHETAALQTTNTTASMAPVSSAVSGAQASAPVAASVISAPLGSHEWQQNISQHVTLFTRQGQQSAELHLHPEDLGQVQISIKLEDNQAQLQMVSAHSHVRQALEAALPMLRTSLAENGIQLGQSYISSESFAGQQQQASQQQQQPSRTGNNGTFGGEEDEAIVAPASLQSAARGTGAVDIFA
ncbi:flagellar hook length control protein FliK [Kosakonia cowanii]|uniref:flagellar hook length control protein FliK n=1 Tax=Kosakonia cowanii TaxID=208223 RepID=UPI0039A60275